MTPETIKTERTARGWTQTRLASELGVTKQTIIAWERGHIAPPHMASLAIERVFFQTNLCDCAPARMLEQIRKMVRK